MNLSLETVLRCLDLLPILRVKNGITLDELAIKTGITKEVIADQLIPTLMLCGSPPYMPHDYVTAWVDGDRVYVEFADQFRRPVTLLPIEITALHLALDTVAVPNDHLPEVRARFRALRDKIERALPADLRVFLDDPERIAVDDRRDVSSPFLQPLRRACERHCKVRIDYLSRGETTAKSRVIHPMGLVVKDGVTYVIAHDNLRGHEVSFRLDRILGAELLDERFSPDPSFSLEHRVREGLFHRPGVDEIEMKVRFAGRAAVIITETLDSRLWRKDRNETVVLTMPTSRPVAAVRWALSFGPEAVVEAPSRCRELYLEEIESLRSVYAG